MPDKTTAQAPQPRLKALAALEQKVLWLATSDHLTAAIWLGSPVTALLVILFVLAGFAHALVGLRSVLLDYVHTRDRLVAAGLLIRAAVVILGGASILAILKLFLGH